jgi:uncharacterized protein (UPF0548 family)
LLTEAASKSLTYEPVGVSLDEATAVAGGLKRRRWAADLDGDEAFGRAVEAVKEWAVHRGAGLLVEADGELAVGTNVAMCAPLPVGYIDVTCRVVAVVDEPDRFGFAYGTLPVHPACGEESFLVSRSDGITSFAVRAVSRPMHPLARLVPPVADALQDRAAKRYLAAMAAAVR